MQLTPAPAPAARQVRCPACGGDSLFATSNPHRPFCSARCRQMDLGDWASERFRVATPNGPDGTPSDPAATPES